MSDPEKISRLTSAVEQIRELTFSRKRRHPGYHPVNDVWYAIPATRGEKDGAWANIQSVTARVLREIEEG